MATENTEETARLCRLAAGLLRQNKPSAAAAAAELATLGDVGSFTAWVALGNAQARLKRPRLAVASYRRALELQPDDVATWTDLGEAYLQLSDYAHAAQALEQAMTRDPEAKDPAGRRARALVAHTLRELKRGA